MWHNDYPHRPLVLRRRLNRVGGDYGALKAVNLRIEKEITARTVCTRSRLIVRRDGAAMPVGCLSACPVALLFPKLMSGGCHDVRDYNGIDGCASVRGSLCRVDAHEGWGRRNAPRGRCSRAPANDVAASTGVQYPINRRPADLEGLCDFRCSKSLCLHGAHLGGPEGRGEPDSIE
jgi:hypothetical protein